MAKPQVKRQRVAIGGALTAVLMALAHVVLTQPEGALTVAIYVELRYDAAPDVVQTLFKVIRAAILLVSVYSLVDFFIYYCLLP